MRSADAAAPLLLRAFGTPIAALAGVSLTSVDKNNMAPEMLLARLRDAWRGPAGGAAWFRVKGESMIPRLPGDSAVLVRPGSRGVRVGSIIAYRSRGDVVVHRVVAIRNGPRGRFFLTKGDGNQYFDHPVPEGCLIGRVVAVELP